MQHAGLPIRRQAFLQANQARLGKCGQWSACQAPQYPMLVHEPAPHRSSESGVSCWADAAASVSSGAAAGCDDGSIPTHAEQAQCDRSHLHQSRSTCHTNMSPCLSQRLSSVRHSKNAARRQISSRRNYPTKRRNDRSTSAHRLLRLKACCLLRRSEMADPPQGWQRARCYRPRQVTGATDWTRSGRPALRARPQPAVPPPQACVLESGIGVEDMGLVAPTYVSCHGCKPTEPGHGTWRLSAPQSAPWIRV